MHTTLCTCSPLSLCPPLAHTPSPGGVMRRGLLLSTQRCSMRSWSQALVSGPCFSRCPTPPRGTTQNKESGGTRPWRHPRGGTAPNDTHDCTTAPIINGRRPLHLQGRKPARCPSRQPHKPSAFPGLTRVVTNHQRMPRRAPPFRSMRLTPRKGEKLVLDTKHLMLRAPREESAQHAS